MKRFFTVFGALVLLLCLLSGCGESTDNTIEVYVGENSFGYTVTGVTDNGDGTTTVTMDMIPMDIKDGDAATNAITLMQIGSKFAILPYLVIDGARVDVENDQANMGIGGTESGRLKCVYTFTFQTEAAPDELWLYPSGRSEETDWHYKIDPETYTILQRAAIEDE